ncbi:MAG: class I SAM-dependent methyltransferase [Candidatus Aegiribacteria sp.]|nr:class I SAM-dependent methyltransferase [Candidatus Aegiribacteria sp.]
MDMNAGGKKVSTDSRKNLIEKGMRAGDTDMYDEDLVWSRNSGDKIDIGEVLMRVIRTINKALPLSRKLRVLSIGSGSEPQFQILESAFRGGMYLLDIDSVPLSIVKDRIQRQWIEHVTTIMADYNRVLVRPEKAEQFLKDKLDGRKPDLITLHHSLYYCDESVWKEFFVSLYRKILARRGAIHAVMMASNSEDRYSTTWLYNHFAGKFFNCRNDQDLNSFGAALEKNRVFSKAKILRQTHCVNFFVDDFEKFMAVIWMILLYPNVHKYSLEQKEEITDHIFDNFWMKKKPLVQIQDHLVIERNMGSNLSS